MTAVLGPGPGPRVARRVVAEVIALAALEVPGVSRVASGAPRWVAWLTGPAVRIRTRDGRVEARVVIIARPGQRLGSVAAAVREAVGASIERLLGLEVAAVSVIVDGVGA